MVYFFSTPHCFFSGKFKHNILEGKQLSCMLNVLFLYNTPLSFVCFFFLRFFEIISPLPSIQHHKDNVNAHSSLCSSQRPICNSAYEILSEQVVSMYRWVLSFQHFFLNGHGMEEKNWKNKNVKQFERSIEFTT